MLIYQQPGEYVTMECRQDDEEDAPPQQVEVAAPPNPLAHGFP
jgi:hypothetical protein